MDTDYAMIVWAMLQVLRFPAYTLKTSNYLTNVSLFSK